MRVHRHLRIGWRHFWRQIFKVVRNPIFLVLTLIGNSVVLLCASIFYLAEHGVNPAVAHPFDALWWAVVTMTTVGYGDIIPVSIFGRLIAMGLMLTGGVFYLSFIALLSSSFVELEFMELEGEVRKLRSKVTGLVEEIEQIRSGDQGEG